MPEPMNIQISFQGGGARLALLLAAAEAIRELESGPEPLIKVTRIAGTSAGAIIGAFLAGGLDLNQISLIETEGRLLRLPCPTIRVPSPDARPIA